MGKRVTSADIAAAGPWTELEKIQVDGDTFSGFKQLTHDDIESYEKSCWKEVPPHKPELVPKRQAILTGWYSYVNSQAARAKAYESRALAVARYVLKTKHHMKKQEAAQEARERASQIVEYAEWCATVANNLEHQIMHCKKILGHFDSEKKFT